jgi:hypothetical protein
VKVSLYTRDRVTRKYRRVTNKKFYLPETIFVLRYADRWETTDAKTLGEATIAAKSRELDLYQHGLPQPSPNRLQSQAKGSPDGQFAVGEEIAKYLTNVRKLAPKTYAAYNLTLSLFQKSCQKEFMPQITRQDLQAFDTYLLSRGDEDRTRANRIQHVVTFLRNKEGRRSGPPIEDVKIRVKYVEQPPEAYTRQELEDLMQRSTDDDRRLWRFFLGTGFRESEVSVAEYSDLNFEKRTIQVIEKPLYGFRPKDCEKRVVPVSDDLIAELRANKNGLPLIFPKNGHVDGQAETP